ncbi:unnamed protein product [Lymnaea stagnalis]|uniref:Uncharacterized protein n=1 Tax=Lymnaea stagnalis TaxID=6523 RepID=A0AAV2HEI6_LYMST
MLLLFIVSYPALVFLHICYPDSKGAKILQFPVIKFSCHAISLLTLLLLIVVSTIESSHSVSKSRTLRSEYSRVHNNSYLKLRRECNYELFGDDFPLRPSSPSVTDILITLWITGLVYQECNQIFTNGILEHLSIYNFLDFSLLSAYVATLSLRYWTMLKFHDALDTLQKTPVTCNDVEQVYWLNTDRLRWSQDDPINVLEGLFAIANIISFFRISYLLPANEILGPLQISLGRMIKVSH